MVESSRKWSGEELPAGSDSKSSCCAKATASALVLPFLLEAIESVGAPALEVELAAAALGAVGARGGTVPRGVRPLAGATMGRAGGASPEATDPTLPLLLLLSLYSDMKDSMRDSREKGSSFPRRLKTPFLTIWGLAFCNALKVAREHIL